jgi:hypothetical protein
MKTKNGNVAVTAIADFFALIASANRMRSIFNNLKTILLA